MMHCDGCRCPTHLGSGAIRKAESLKRTAWFSPLGYRRERTVSEWQKVEVLFLGQQSAPEWDTPIIIKIGEFVKLVLIKQRRGLPHYHHPHLFRLPYTSSWKTHATQLSHLAQQHLVSVNSSHILSQEFSRATHLSGRKVRRQK